MDKSILVFNIRKYCAAKNMKPTIACTVAGVGRSFLSDIDRGQTPSVAKVADLAAFLDVSASDLIGDARTPAELAPIADAWADLNDAGRAEAVQYVRYLATKPEYKKDHPDLDSEEDAVG